MSRESILKRMLDGGIVAVVRADSGASLAQVVKALAEGGVTAAEITFTVPDAVDVIRQVRSELGDAIALGAGTVLDPETARDRAAGRGRVHRLADGEHRGHQALPPVR